MLPDEQVPSLKRTGTMTSEMCLPQAGSVCPHSRTVGTLADTLDGHATHKSGMPSLAIRRSGTLAKCTCHMSAECQDSRPIRIHGISAGITSSLHLSVSFLQPGCLHLTPWLLRATTFLHQEARTEIKHSDLALT